jgi:5-carboxymethyl-2-hydroxymuconate isomerase
LELLDVLKEINVLSESGFQTPRINPSVFGKNRASKRKVSESVFEGIVEKAIESFVKIGELIDREILAKRYRLNYVQSAKLTLRLREVRKNKLRSSETNEDFVKTEEVFEETKAALNEHLQRIRLIVEQDRMGAVKQSDIREGFVYLICNSIWDGWVKVGMTVDFENRLEHYNVGDPHSNYKFIDVSHVSDRRKVEKELIELLTIAAETVRGEWFKIDKQEACEIFGEGIGW